MKGTSSVTIGKSSDPTPADIAPDDADDVELMLRIAAGDQAAFRHFAARHAPRCLAIAERILGNGADAEEIVQDGLLRVWQYAASWRRTEARVTTWLYRIMVNRAIDRARKNRYRFVELDQAGTPADPAPNAQSLIETRQMERVLDAAIRALPERQRIALTLCAFEGLGCAEAAGVLQISVSAMESLLVRARRTLRWQLSRHGLAEEAASHRSHAARFPALNFDLVTAEPA